PRAGPSGLLAENGTMIALSPGPKNSFSTSGNTHVSNTTNIHWRKKRYPQYEPTSRLVTRHTPSNAENYYTDRQAVSIRKSLSEKS
ncbi:MAG TPA: hypothetical protein PK297_09280, partial [Spirochaetota bacterium]|nr:hypothetical protein [Spirochaetota bacterium]